MEFLENDSKIGGDFGDLFEIIDDARYAAGIFQCIGIFLEILTFSN